MTSLKGHRYTSGGKGDLWLNQNLGDFLYHGFLHDGGEAGDVLKHVQGDPFRHNSRYSTSADFDLNGMVVIMSPLALLSPRPFLGTALELVSEISILPRQPHF
jgi:hypothetical protein